MHVTDEPKTDEKSPLDAAVIDYIDSEELTDTAVLPEPMSEKIADKLTDVIDEAKAVVSHYKD